MLNDVPEIELKEGDFSGVPSLEVLRKAAAESQDIGRFSADQFHDVLLTMKASKTCDVTSRTLIG